MEAYALHQEQRSEHVWEGDQRRPHRSFDAEEWGGNVLDMQLGGSGKPGSVFRCWN